MQLVERGATTLDEPVYGHLPELESLPLITRGAGDEKPFGTRPPTKKITLRHLLLHTSGLSGPDNPIVHEYLKSDAAVKPVFADDAPFIVKNFSIPLIFEPGEGFAYGYSIHWTQLLVSRLAVAGGFIGHIKEHIFGPLGMTSSTYRPRDSAEIWGRRLRMVEREGDRLVPADDASQGLMCSMSDVGRILSDLVSPSSELLHRQEHLDLLFTEQFASSSTALKDLRGNHENYAFCMGKPGTGDPDNMGPLPRVNWSAAGQVAEDELPRSRMPRGTVTWEGMPNVLWAMNRKKGLGMFFATQLIPVGDEMANAFALAFISSAWNKFG